MHRNLQAPNEVNILMLTDSLGHPRIDGFGTKASEVWTYLVRNKLKQNTRLSFYFDMQGGRTTTSLKSDVNNYLKCYEPDIIVLQVGIVDCYPRSITQAELRWLSRIPIINKFSAYLVKKYYKQIVLIRDITYVSYNTFKKNIKEIIASFPAAKFIALPIAPPCNNFINKNPLVERNIDKYNSILKTFFKSDYFDGCYANADIEQLFLQDNHHLTKYGHSLVAENLTKKILTLTNGNP